MSHSAHLPGCTRLSQHHLARHGDDILAPHLLRLRVRAGRALFIEDHLRDPIAVAQVDESQRAKVAPTRHPAHQRHTLSDISRAQRAA